MRLRTIGASWVAGAVCLLLGAGALAQGGGGGFTRDERRRLLAGELVRRPTTSREGRFRFIGGTSFQRVDAPRDEVWAAVKDTRAYTRLIPGVVEARIVEDHGDRRLMYMRHRYAFVSASYFANVTIDEAQHTIHFELDPTRPHDVRAGRGFVTVDGFRGDESIVTWGVRADVGQGLLTGVFAPVIHDWILRVPECVRGYMAGAPVC